MVTKKQAQELRKYSPELKFLKKELTQVKYGGSFNVTSLKNKGLIKLHVLKKGVMRQGDPNYGRKTKWILTEKGKRMLSALEGLGF